jgi:hypothetical protein
VLPETAVTFPVAAGGVPCLKPEVVVAVVEVVPAAWVCMATVPATPPANPTIPKITATFFDMFIIFQSFNFLIFQSFPSTFHLYYRAGIKKISQKFGLVFFERKNIKFPIGGIIKLIDILISP